MTIKKINKALPIISFPIYTAADLKAKQFKSDLEYLIWDHTNLDQSFQQKLSLKLGLLPNSDLKVFLQNKNPFLGSTTKVKLDQYFYTINQKISWSVFVKKNKHWLWVKDIIKVGNNLSYWSGSQIPDSDFFWVTVVHIDDQPNLPHYQQIRLYKFDWNDLDLKPYLDKDGNYVDIKFSVNSEYHNQFMVTSGTPCWRDAKMAINMSSTRKNIERIGVFCATDKENLPVIGLFELTKDLKVILKNPIRLPDTANLKEIEVPSLIAADEGDYLFGSIEKSGKRITTAWFKALGSDEWIVVDEKKQLFSDVPLPYTMYAGSVEKVDDQLKVFGWLGDSEGKIMGQSEEFSITCKNGEVKTKPIKRKKFIKNNENIKIKKTVFNKVKVSI